MDLNRLQYFLVVCQTEHMKRASEILGISSPAISKALKILEEEIGHKLIINEGRGIKITDKGRELARLIEPQLGNLNKIKDELDSSRSLMNSIRFGTFEVFSTYFAGELFHKVFKDYEVSLYELIPGKIEQALEDFQIDYGITYLPIPHPKIEHIKIGEVSMGVFAKKNTFKNVVFEDLPFVIPIRPIDSSPTKVKGLDGWPDDLVYRNIKYRVGLMESALEFLRQGMAVAYLPTFVVELHNRSVKSEFHLSEVDVHVKVKKQKQGIYLVKRKTDIESEVDKKIAKGVRTIMKTT